MDGLVDVVSAWMVSERERAERERDVGRAWLTVMVEGDPDKIGTMITELADRSASLDYDVVEKLRASALAYMQEVTKASFKEIVRLRCNRGCSCGCEACEEEEAVVRPA
jgi:hypothetical protein